MTTADALQSVDQLARAWQAFVLDHGASTGQEVDVSDLPGMAVRWADSEFTFWNALTLTEDAVSADLLDERLHGAAEYLRGRSRAGLLWLFEDLLDPPARAGLAGAVERAGLTPAMRGWGMAGDILPIPEPVGSPLRFERVRTDEGLRAYADLNSRAYGLPLSDGRDGLDRSRLWTSDRMFTYLGLRDGVPVTAASTIEVDGCLFLALVATAPEEQHKGYGEAVVRKVLHEGAEATGATRATLHATEAGAPVYRRLGYRQVADLGFYALKG